MTKQRGFTLIELLIFIIITSLLASGILLSYIGAMEKSPSILENTIALQTARQCAEWYISQRRSKGYSVVSGANCTNPLTLPSFCTSPAGYTLTGTCSQTTIRSDTNYELFTINVSGTGSASIMFLLAEY